MPENEKYCQLNKKGKIIGYKVFQKPFSLTVLFKISYCSKTVSFTYKWMRKSIITSEYFTFLVLTQCISNYHCLTQASTF